MPLNIYQNEGFSFAILHNMTTYADFVAIMERNDLLEKAVDRLIMQITKHKDEKYINRTKKKLLKKIGG